ncbi:MAG: zinc-binding dehydrogenase [Chloroflexota bacterium]|nr:zinc-binding dehydrogenase [Chloroflexota bacterium]
MITGRAAAFYGAGKPMDIKEYPVIDPEPGWIVVRMTMANVCGSDLHQWRGEFDVSRFGRPYPQILGHEMTGTVHTLGEGVERDTAGQPLRPGDRVVWRYFYPCGTCRACLKRITRACPNARTYLARSCDEAPHFYGAFGDYYVLRPGAAIFKVPDELTDAMVAGINCALSQVVGGMQLSGMKLGDNVVIQGAGGLGVYATAVAKELGAGQVIVIDSIPERLQLARDFGADQLIDIEESPDPDMRVKRVLELTDNWGADVVAELVGHPRVCNEGLRMLGRTGRYLEIGNINPGLTFELDPSTLIFGNRSILGMVYYEAEHLQQALELMRRTRDRYPWARVVSHTFPLEQINEAFAEADRGRVTRAAIVP